MQYKWQHTHNPNAVQMATHAIHYNNTNTIQMTAPMQYKYSTNNNIRAMQMQYKWQHMCYANGNTNGYVDYNQM